MITAQQRNALIGNGIGDRMIKTMEMTPVFAAAGTVIGTNGQRTFRAVWRENVQCPSMRASI